MISRRIPEPSIKGHVCPKDILICVHSSGCTAATASIIIYRLILGKLLSMIMLMTYYNPEQIRPSSRSKPRIFAISPHGLERSSDQGGPCE